MASASMSLTTYAVFGTSEAAVGRLLHASDGSAGVGDRAHPRGVSGPCHRDAGHRYPGPAGCAGARDVAAGPGAHRPRHQHSPARVADIDPGAGRVWRACSMPSPPATRPTPKPAPDLYLLACERLGVAPEFAVGLEDSPTGVRAVKAAGLHCIAIPSDPGLGCQSRGRHRRIAAGADANGGHR